MARENPSLLAFNRGLISRLGLARIDLKRLGLAAAVMTNWMPRVLGSMMLRPGLGYLFGILNNAACRYLRFEFSTYDTALLELTDSVMRVVINDTLLTRPAVTSAVTNGTFPTDLSSWTSYDDAGATSSWAAPNYMQLLGNGTSRAIREQQVTNATPSVEHALRIVIARGPVTLRIGSTSGDDDYVSETTLYTGTHSIAFTPTGNFFVRFFSAVNRITQVSNCTVESAGVVQVPTPWVASDLSMIRTEQSADVVFAACSGKQQRRIERRGIAPNARSWSVVVYQSPDGPFQVQNTTATTLTAGALSGNTTLTSSVPLFKTTHNGALFSITSTGQVVTTVAAASGIFTNSIRVTGVADSRTVSVVISGDATGSTVDLQRSYDNSTWANVGGIYSYTADTTTAFADNLANQIVYYRLKLTTRVAPDTVTMTLRIGSGSIRGIGRVTSYTSSTVVNVEVLSAFGSTNPEKIWQEGSWSDKKGWPTSVRLHDGRMWWFGKNGAFGSIPDAFDSYDETFLGDSAPINRTIGSGPVDIINWALSLQRLICGAQGAEFTVKSSSLDEPITPSNFNIKASTNQGSGSIEAVKVDDAGIFVNRTGAKVFELAFDVRSYNYQIDDLMALVPELGLPGIVRMAYQRQPDTRIHCVRSDGTAIVAVRDKSEDVLAWVMVQTAGFIEDVVVLPALAGSLDDQVYYVVRRNINGSTVRYLEKWAQEIDCRGDKAGCNLADSYRVFTNTSAPVVSHLAGQPVVVWADGNDIGTNDAVVPWTYTYTASGTGTVTLPQTYGTVVVGLPYQAPFQSTKLGEMTQAGSPLNQQKRMGHLGLILADYHRKGLRFGPQLDVTLMDDMPQIEDGAPVPTASQTAYDQNVIEFPSEWTTDLRVCLMAQAPRPVTVLALTPDFESHA